MAEYHDYGPGYNVTGRAISLFDTQLNDTGYAPYSSPAKVFMDPQGKPDSGWIDYWV